MNMFEFLFIFASADCVRHLSVTFIVSQTITYRRLLRFGFDVLESGKFKCQSETRQRDAPWCILLYTWGFNVARLPLTGRFPEPQYVKRAEERLHVLYCFWQISLFVVYPFWSRAEK